MTDVHPDCMMPDGGDPCRGYAELWAEKEKLRAGIQAFIEGGYDDPRSYRPHDCPHGRPYYQDCNQCDVEHFVRVLADARNRANCAPHKNSLTLNSEGDA